MYRDDCPDTGLTLLPGAAIGRYVDLPRAGEFGDAAAHDLT
jgi:hypothetical protein